MRIASKKQSAGAILLGMVIGAIACVEAYNPDCGPLAGNQTCPDGSTGTGYANCTTTDTKTLNQETDTGYYTQSSSGNCIYTCTYVDGNGVTVNCGSKTNAWNGTKPNSTTCPSS